MQSYRERMPAPALAAYLACVWVQEVEESYAHRTVPNAAAELSCRVGGVPLVTGPRTGHALELLAPGTTVVGVRFRPGAAPALLGMPASELVDVATPADDVLATGPLAERIASAPSSWEAAGELERFLLARLRDAPAPDPLIAEAVRRLLWRANEVTDLTTALYISERQLRRRSTDAIGLAPKAVHRILRFQGFLALAHGREPFGPDLAQLAAEAGYADQPHLARESLRLAGLTPRELLRESARHCAPAHDHAATFGPLLSLRSRSATTTRRTGR
jgi:AraC-like DNA-binding protein